MSALGQFATKGVTHRDKSHKGFELNAFQGKTIQIMFSDSVEESNICFYTLDCLRSVDRNHITEDDISTTEMGLVF